VASSDPCLWNRYQKKRGGGANSVVVTRAAKPPESLSKRVPGAGPLLKKKKNEKKGGGEGSRVFNQELQGRDSTVQKRGKGEKEKEKPVVVTRAAKAPEYLTKSFRAVTP
jgi:hypothetical protein